MKTIQLDIMSKLENSHRPYALGCSTDCFFIRLILDVLEKSLHGCSLELEGTFSLNGSMG